MRFDFDPVNGRLAFSDQEAGAKIVNAEAWLSYRLNGAKLQRVCVARAGDQIEESKFTDEHGPGTLWTCRCPSNRDGIQLSYDIKRYEQHKFILLKISVSNLGREPAAFREACLFLVDPSKGGAIHSKTPPHGLRFFKVGWHGWDFTGWRTSKDRNRLTWMEGLTSLSYSNPATPKPTRAGEFSSEGWAILEGADCAIVAGFASTANQFGQVFANLRAGQESLQLSCQADEMRLDPGESWETDWGFLQFVPLPNPSPEADYVAAVSRQMKARVPALPPPTMWTHWYQFYNDIDEQRFVKNLDQLVEKHSEVPCQVVELDDGYQSAWGDWTTTNDRFPHGLAWLAGEIRTRGFTPGIWLAPFAVQGRSQLALDHPEWLVKGNDGKPARAGFVYNMFIYALDLTQPQVLEHLRSLASTLAHEFSYSMLKLDFLNCAALPGIRSNPKLTRAEALRLGLEAIRQGAGDETFLLGCGCPFGPAIGVVDAMRIGPDTAPSWEPYFHWLPWARPLMKNNPSMPALRNALRNTMLLSSLNRKWWWNDPDCVLVRDEDTRLTRAEVQSAVSLAGLSGGMLVSSDDLGKVPTERLNWLSQLIPNLGLQSLPVPLKAQGIPDIYCTKVQQGAVSWQLIAVFNWENKSVDRSLRFSELGYTAEAPLHVFDFWDRQYWCSARPEFLLEQIPAHGCKLLRVCVVGQAPQLVGDTLHISQGGELSSMRIVEHRLEMDTIDLGRHVHGELWFSLDRAPAAAYCRNQRVPVEGKGAGVYTVPVDFWGRANIVVEL